MFSWFKKEKEIDVKQSENLVSEDQIEEALWDIKEQFDLETEEVEKTVLDKRQKLNYMRKTLKREL
jgi:hypothetical protein|tara:strand:+ start:633 stop:830 length:198 start_codon:yes stop_codon:yes gene_type:complete